MYSQYINGVFAPLVRSEGAHFHRNRQLDDCKSENPSGSIAGSLEKLLKDAGRQFSVRNLDTGDILLILIIFLLFLEGDNLELVITLGLMILLGSNESAD